MSTNKEFSDTSAGRYSLALYELAEELNCVNEVEIHSNALIKLISENKDFSSLIKDPTSNQNDQLKVSWRIHCEKSNQAVWYSTIHSVFH